MPRTVRDLLAHSEDLAKRFEEYEPSAEDERDPEALLALRHAVESRAHSEQAIVEAVTQARASAYSWRTIGSMVGTSGEAARQRYGSNGTS